MYTYELQEIESDTCDGCAFDGTRCYLVERPGCSPKTRTDGKNVIFKLTTTNQEMPKLTMNDKETYSIPRNSFPHAPDTYMLKRPEEQRYVSGGKQEIIYIVKAEWEAYKSQTVLLVTTNKTIAVKLLENLSSLAIDNYSFSIEEHNII